MPVPLSPLPSSPHVCLHAVVRLRKEQELAKERGRAIEREREREKEEETHLEQERDHTLHREKQVRSLLKSIHTCMRTDTGTDTTET